MVKAYILDDDSNSINTLESMIEEHCKELKVIGSATELTSAIKEIKDLQPELLFLDINLGDKLVFDIYDQIDLTKVHVVFVSGNTQFALKAFRLNAVDFLSKPIIADELLEAEQKVIDAIARNEINSKLSLIISELKSDKQTPVEEKSKLSFPTAYGYSFFDVDEIVRFMADGNYCFLYLTRERKMMVSRPLSKIEKMVDPFNFQRVHHSHLVNLNHVTQFKKKGLSNILILTDNSEVEVSYRKKKALLKSLQLK